MWSLFLQDVTLAKVKEGLDINMNTEVLNSEVKFYSLLFALQR